MNAWHYQQSVLALKQGGIIAYPTEAVYGLGCDPLNPEAVMRLLALKQRSMDKGLILIASDIAMILDWIMLTPAIIQQLQQTYAYPITWLIPCPESVPQWIRGEHQQLAIRLTQHPIAKALCQAWSGLLISTSANISQHPPARSKLQLHKTFGKQLDYIVPGNLGLFTQVSEIRDITTQTIIRSGPSNATTSH